MQNVIISTSGNIKLLDTVNGSDISVGYSLPFNYLDGQVDFNGSQINNDAYALGYSYDNNPELTHFNGAESCNIGLFWNSNDEKSLIRNFCHIKTKYLSISGTSITIQVTSSSNLYQDTISQWEVGNTVKTMVKSGLPNAKYFLTSNVSDLSSQGGIANTVPQINSTMVLTGDIFPMYFPKRDTLILKGNYLNQG